MILGILVEFRLQPFLSFLTRWRSVVVATPAPLFILRESESAKTRACAEALEKMQIDPLIVLRPDPAASRRIHYTAWPTYSKLTNYIRLIFCLHVSG